VKYRDVVILTGPTAHDPDDCVTDDAEGGQFIEIAEMLKKRYGNRLRDLIPTDHAFSGLMDLWGWALKAGRGRDIARRIL